MLSLCYSYLKHQYIKFVIWQLQHSFSAFVVSFPDWLFKILLIIFNDVKFLLKIKKTIKKTTDKAETNQLREWNCIFLYGFFFFFLLLFLVFPRLVTFQICFRRSNRITWIADRQLLNYVTVWMTFTKSSLLKDSLENSIGNILQVLMR